VIACRGGDDTAFLLFDGQLCKGIPRAAFLKTSRALQVVELAKNFDTRDFT